MDVSVQLQGSYSAHRHFAISNILCNGIPHGDEKDSHMDKMERKSKWTRGRGHSHEHQERGNLDDMVVKLIEKEDKDINMNIEQQ